MPTLFYRFLLKISIICPVIANDLFQFRCLQRYDLHAFDMLRIVLRVIEVTVLPVSEIRDDIYIEVCGNEHTVRIRISRAEEMRAEMP